MSELIGFKQLWEFKRAKQKMCKHEHDKERYLRTGSRICKHCRLKIVEVKVREG